jgi:hypothetical protein|tara:strand:+ start:880 stop:1008 length:129 start_codon:yes stop_codon:yes gene_type:complete
MYDGLPKDASILQLGKIAGKKETPKACITEISETIVATIRLE